MGLRDRTIALAVTGSVAAYKAVEVARLLVAEGAKVRPVMSRSAEKFLGATTLSAIAGAPVATDLFDAAFPGEMHVAIAGEADLVLVVPATADLLARLANGRADDLVCALVLCAKGPVLVAPAMHARMWLHPATQRNVARLREDGRVAFVGPVEGPLASGEVGIGRMAAPADVVTEARRLLGAGDLAGLRVVVTAGPTVEDLDPVRFLGNRSSGRMGFAIAERAASRGAEVTLVAGPVQLSTPPGVRRVDVRGALAMRDALADALGPDLSRADALVMAAAVADYRPAETSSSKLKKTAERVAVELVKNPDLLAEIGAARAGRRPLLVGFALETGSDQEVVAYAKKKLADKRVDFVVANHAADALGGATNRATLVGADRVEPLGEMDKRALADRILDRVRDGGAVAGAGGR